MQPMLAVTAPHPGLIYINGRFSGEVSREQPLLRPVCATGALYLDYRPLTNACRAMARRIVFSGGAPMAESIEAAEDLSAVIWPGNVTELELTPETRDMPPRSVSLSGHELVLEGDPPVLRCDGRTLCALPEGAEPPSMQLLPEGAVLLGRCDEGAYLLCATPDLRSQTGFLRARQIDIEGDGRIRAIVAPGDIVGHATLEIWRLTAEGLTLVTSEPAWAQGAPRWRLSLGVRAVGLRGDTLCGDAGACFQVRTLQYVLLCDGMGTGAGAKADAEEAISLLRAMITAGFAAPEAMALLNELYLLRGDGCFSTIDLLELDLCTAEGVLYKWGAAPSYLKKGGNVKKIGTASPPPGLGVGEEHRAGGVRLSLQRGELLVLTTDGVPEAACEQYLRTCGALSPRELAAGVVACASESEPDDRTAAAVQLEPVSLQPHHITRRARNVSKAGARPHI